MLNPKKQKRKKSKRIENIKSVKDWFRLKNKNSCFIFNAK